MNIRAAVVLLALTAIACASPVLPSPSPSMLSPSPTPSAHSTSVSPSPTPSPTASPTMSPRPQGLYAGGMATVVVDKLKQVVDPQHPDARPSGNPGYNLIPPRLAPLHNGDRVYLLDSEIVDGVTWWKVIDRDFPGCCWPLFWIASTVDGADSLEPLALECPDVSVEMSAAELAGLGSREALTCFGQRDVQVEGIGACGQAIADAGAFLTAPWETDPEDPFVCLLDESAYDLRGDILEPWTESGDGRQMVATGHFDDPRSGLCAWTPGNMGNFVPPEGGPRETAEMMCRLQFVVTQVELR